MKVYTGRSYRGYGAYGDQALDSLANVVAQASPWNAIVAGFTSAGEASKSKAEIAALQTQSAMARSASITQIAKYGVYGVGALAAVLMVAVIVKGKKP